MNAVQPSGKRIFMVYRRQPLHLGDHDFLLVVLTVSALSGGRYRRLSFIRWVFYLQKYLDFFAEPRIYKSFYNSMYAPL